MMECARIQKLISMMLDGQVTKAELAEINEHIAHCDECKLIYESFMYIQEEIRHDNAPADLHEKIMRAVDGTMKANKSRAIVHYIKSFAAAAACIGLVATAVLGVTNGMRIGSNRKDSSSTMTYGLTADESCEDNGSEVPGAFFAAPQEPEAAPEAPAPMPEMNVASTHDSNAEADAENAVEYDTMQSVCDIRLKVLNRGDGSFTGKVTDPESQTLFEVGDEVTVTLSVGADMPRGDEVIVSFRDYSLENRALVSELITEIK